MPRSTAFLPLVLALVACQPAAQPATSVEALAGTPAAPAAAPVQLHLDHEERSEDKLEAQLIQHFVVVGSPSNADLQFELARRMASAFKRAGFNQHSAPTTVGIFAYASHEQARAGQGLWVAKAVAIGDGEPTFAFNQARVAEPPAPGASPAVDRKVIYAEMVAQEKKATADAAAGKGVEGELREAYWAVLAKRHGLTDDELIGIAVQAQQEGWPR